MYITDRAPSTYPSLEIELTSNGQKPQLHTNAQRKRQQCNAQNSQLTLITFYDLPNGHRFILSPTSFSFEALI